MSDNRAHFRRYGVREKGVTGDIQDGMRTWQRVRTGHHQSRAGQASGFSAPRCSIVTGTSPD